MKDIKNYEGIYAITEDGRVWSYKYSKFLKARPSADGYLYVGLSNNYKYKNCLVHRLVAEAYLPNPNNWPQVNHKDENKANNSVSNLEWCSNQYNIDYSQSKRVLCVELNEIFKSTQDAAKNFNLSQGNISGCCRGERKTCGGYHWRFV